MTYSEYLQTTVIFFRYFSRDAESVKIVLMCGQTLLALGQVPVAGAMEPERDHETPQAMDETTVVDREWRKQGILNLENRRRLEEGSQDTTAQPRIGYALKVKDNVYCVVTFICFLVFFFYSLIQLTHLDSLTKEEAPTAIAPTTAWDPQSAPVPAVLNERDNDDDMDVEEGDDNRGGIVHVSKYDDDDLQMIEDKEVGRSQPEGGGGVQLVREARRVWEARMETEVLELEEWKLSQKTKFKQQVGIRWANVHHEI